MFVRFLALAVLAALAPAAPSQDGRLQTSPVRTACTGSGCGATATYVPQAVLYHAQLAAGPTRRMSRPCSISRSALVGHYAGVARISHQDRVSARSVPGCGVSTGFSGPAALTERRGRKVVLGQRGGCN